MNVAQNIVNGVITGSGYACVALGWTVLLGAARLVNFAHGQMYMLAAFLCWYAATRLGLGYAAGSVLAVAVMIVLGVVLQLAMNRLVIQQNLTSLMIVTLGIGYVVQGAAGLAFGGAPQNLPSGLESVQFNWGPVWFTAQDILLLAATLVLYGVVGMLLGRTRFGAVIRAVAEDPPLARLFGISPSHVYVAIFALESALVGAAAVLAAPRAPILTSMGFQEVIFTFAVVVLGGIGSVSGALVASYGLGLFTAFFGALVSPAYATAAAFGLLLVVLVARPLGLAGR